MGALRSCRNMCNRIGIRPARLEQTAALLPIIFRRPRYALFSQDNPVTCVTSTLGAPSAEVASGGVGGIRLDDSPGRISGASVGQAYQSP